MDRNTARPGVLRGQTVRPGPVPPVMPSHVPASRGKRTRKVWWGVGLALLLVVVILGMMMWRGMGTKMPASDRYQAVFMNNGQVFFGKLKNVQGPYMSLEKAYYTKKQDLPADATDEQKAAVANNVSLVKVGDEVYGPENSMMIRSDQVLFWQDLRGDSKVAKAIDANK